MPDRPHLALVGPTAAGKSALALELAEALGDVEIVSVDSMQVYRGMDVGTAKATAAERARVPHHLLDVADPSEEWSVARFQTEARVVVADIERRGRRALLVGGTGLYLRAVIDDLRFPGEDLEVRARLEAEADEPGGLLRLYEELVARDPVAAARVEPANRRRVVRALEVMEITRAPFSASGVGLAEHGEPVFPVRQHGVWLPGAVLDARIRARVDRMYSDGLLEEAGSLVAPGRPPLSRTAAQAIGYREAIAVVDPDGSHAGEVRGPDGGGARPLGAGPAFVTAVEAARATTALRTRQLARRQIRWFRRDPRITWWGTAGNPLTLTPALLECCS